MKHKHLRLSLTLGLSGVLLMIVTMLLRPPTPGLGHPLGETEVAVTHGLASRVSADVATPAPDMLSAPEAPTLYNRVASIPISIPGTEHPQFGTNSPVGDFPLAPPLGSDADFVVSLDSDRVWGLVGANETVTVTVNGAQMGATRANNLGFFWTTLYDANGDRPNLSGGETVSIYHDGALAASTTLRSIAGQVDPLNDDVNGVIGGAGFPLEVTVYTGQTGEPTLISYGQSANTDGSGNFTVDFTGNWDYFANEYVVIAYTEGGVEVHRYARAQRLVVQPFPNMGVTGFSTPGATVTVTVYTADGVTVREQLSDSTDPETGQYRFSPGMETADIVVVEVEGGLVMSRTVDLFEFTLDAQNDRMVGLTTPGAMLLGRANELTANGYTAVLVHGVADASGVFTLDFSASTDLMPGDWVGAYIADAEGDDLNLWEPVQGFVDVNQTWNEVSGWAVTPPGSLGEGHPLTLTIYQAADDSVSIYTKGSGWYGSYSFNQDDELPDIEPGDVITVESEGYAWQGVVHVQPITATVDLENDRFTGAVTAPTERVELWGRLGSSEPYLYPLAGEFTMLATGASLFSGVPAGFDVDYGIGYEIRHRTAGDNIERINGVTDEFGAWLPGPFMWAAITPPETPYTLTVYNSAGIVKTQTTGTSRSPVGSTDGFDVQATGQTIQPGDFIQAQSATGFSQTVMVPALSVNAVPGDDLVTGYGPANTLLHFGVYRNNDWDNNNRFAEGYVSTDADGAYAFRVNQLQVVSDDGILRPRDIFHISYLTPEQAWIIDGYEIPFAEVGVQKWNPGGFARPGGKAVYSISYQNNGNTTAADTVIVDTLPLSTTYAGDNSGFTPEIGAEGVITWHVGNLDPGAYRQFAVTLNVDASVPEGNAVLENCLTISTATPGDNDPGNDQACNTVSVGNDEVEMGVDKWPDPGDPTPGQEFYYHIGVCNHRGTMAGPVLLTDTLPNYVSVVYWNHDNPWAVGWQEVTAPAGIFALTTAGFPGNFCDTIHLRLLLDADAPLGTNLSNHVIIAVPDDVYEDNNWRLNQDANVSTPRYDLHLDKNMHSGVLVPGGWINYFLWYNNQGNTTSHVWVTDTIPAGLSFDFAHWGGGQPGENEPLPAPTVVGDQIVWDLGELPVSGSRWFHVQMNITDTLDAGDIITNCAVIGSDEAESTPADNESCYSVTLNDSGPNLRVTKESWWNGDGQLGYRVHFYNLGDAIVNNFWITDTLPTGTYWDEGWNLNWDWGRLVTQSLNSDVLAWQFSDFHPGEYAQLEFNANLDEPGVPLRWFTNTVEITTVPNETTSEDNTYTDVAFSGGEVQWVDFDVYRTRVWGCAPQSPITVTTALEEMTFWDNCWNENNFPDTFDPGDVITVTAGAGLHPVVITIPDPFTGQTSSITDTVWGQIDALDHETIQVDLWGFPTQYVETDDQGNYSATYPDIPHGAQGDVGYWTEIDYAQVGFHHRLVNLDLSLNINYDHDWVEGNYEGGHTVWLTVTNASKAIKATATLTTGAIPWWGGGQTGFSTNLNDPWQPQHPDIQPGDFVYAATESGYTAAVEIGQITGFLDVDADSITGTVDASWLLPGPVDIECHTWGSPHGAPNKYDNIIPDGNDTYTCAWDPNDEWDIEPGQDLAVMYREPAGHNIFAVYHAPAPRMQVGKWLEGGNIGVDGNAVFHVQYANFGDADAENVVITDTLQGMTFIADTSGFASTGGGDQVVWNLGTVAPGGWVYFNVFAEVTATAGERVTNTVEIATSNPYDQSNEWDRRAGWSGDVQDNDTRLNVGKWAWTGDPAAGYDVIFSVNVCNFGSTASAEVVLTDTLHPSLTLQPQTWWAQHPGWVEVSSNDHELVVARPSIPGGWCSEVYVRATVDAAAWPGMPISNTATIYAANDLSEDDDETWWWGNINTPHTNLNIDKYWNGGRLVPGGELHYRINLHNNGNVPIGSFRVTDTLPISTTFQSAWRHDEYGSHEFAPLEVGDGYVVWEFPGLVNGFGDNLEIVLDVDPDALPGTVLVNTAEVTSLPGEDTYDDNVSVWTETLFDHGPNLRVRKDGQWDDWGENTRRASYWFNVENVGDVRVDMVTITDTYPAGMHLDGGIGGNFWRWWEPQDHGDHFTITLEMLEPGWSTGFNFGLITDTEPLPFGLIFTNTVEVILVEDDANRDDNIDTAVLTTGPDLWVQKSVVDDAFLPGELVTFSLVFGNDRRGNEGWWNTQGNVWLTDTLPSGFEFITATRRSWGWAPYPPDVTEGDILAWNTGNMPAGGEDELLVTVRIPAAVTGLDTFTNWAEVASDQPAVDIEPYDDNNTDYVDVMIDLPYFEVSKAYESTAVAGMPITYTLTVTNIGNSIGTGIILSDTIPDGLENVNGGTLILPWMWWYIDSLAPNGGVATEMFEATLPCAVGTVVNDDYRVVDSDQGVSSAVGEPVSVDVIAPTLTAEFDQSAVTVLVSTTLHFTDTSTTNGPDIVAWAWDFDDGHSADGANVTHTYTTDGVFTVRLTITDTCGYTATTTSDITIAAPALVASFIQSTALAEIGATVYFTDASTTNLLPIFAWAWDFGDGSPLVFTQNASHAYDAENTFTITLTVTDTLGYSDSFQSTVQVKSALHYIFLPLVLRNY